MGGEVQKGLFAPLPPFHIPEESRGNLAILEMRLCVSVLGMGKGDLCFEQPEPEAEGC